MDKQKRNYTQDIEKLRMKKDKEEEAVEEAKKLRNEIEQEMGKSFEMIEERQNEVKDFLHQREKEEEEHKRRAADIVKRLQNGMMDIEDNIKNKPINRKSKPEEQQELIKTDEDNSRRFGNFHMNSTQTEIIKQVSQHIQTTPDELDALLQNQGANLNKKRIKEEDIPDVIEAIKENLVEKMKLKLADEQEKNEDKTKGNNEISNEKKKDLPFIRNEIEAVSKDGGTLSDDDLQYRDDFESDQLPRKLTELARSLIDNKINDEEVPEAIRDKIGENKNQLVSGLLENVVNVDEIPGVSENASDDLQEAYASMQTDFNNLADFVSGNGKYEDDVGEARLTRCRELCKEIDKIEMDLEELNGEIISLQDSENKGDEFVDHSEYGQKQEMSEGTGTVERQVAEFDPTYADDNGIYNGKDAPAKEVGNRKLAELIRSKVNADAKLNLKLDNLRLMLGQRQQNTTLQTNSSLADSDTEGKEKKDMAALENTQLRLQKELDHAYRANKKLAKENERLLQEAGAVKDAMDVDEELFGGRFDIPRWQNERQLREKLTKAEEGIGEELFDAIVNSKTQRKKSLEKVKDFELLQIENKTVADLLKLYKENEGTLSEQLTSADVTNAINDIVNIKRTDTNRLMEDLQNEAKKTDELIVDQEVLAQETENELNELIKQRLDEISDANERQEEIANLEKKIVTMNDAINNCFLAKDRDTVLGNLDDKIAEIDRQIELIGVELKKGSERENGVGDEDLRETERLRKMLERLRPYAAEEERMDENGVKSYQVPAEVEVDDIIKEKLKLLQQYDEQQKEEKQGSDRALNGRQVQLSLGISNGLETSIDGENVEASNDETILRNAKQLENIKNELELTDEEIEAMDIRAEEIPFLKDAISSMKNSIAEMNEDVDKARSRSLERNETNELLEKIEEQIETLKEELLDTALKGTENNQAHKVTDNKLEEITRENANEKVKKLCEMLERERARVAEVIANTQDLAEDITSSNRLKFVEFKSRYESKTNEIKTEMEERLDAVNRVLRDASEELMSSKNEGDNEGKSKILEEKKEKLAKLKEGIAQVMNDLEGIKTFEKEGQIGDLQDSDAEELLYKIEAIEISIERMGRTIEDAKGYSKTLDTLLKRQDRMKESLEGVKHELARLRDNMARDLSDLQFERKRTEVEIKEILGEGEIENEGEKEAILELIGSFAESSDVSKEEQELERYIMQRERLAKDYEDFDKLGGLTERDGRFIEDMIQSVELDINDALEEIDEVCKGYEFDNNLAFNKVYLNNMVEQRSGLHCALQQLGKIIDGFMINAVDDGQEQGGKESQQQMNFEELQKLAEAKISLIDDKLHTLNSILENPVLKNGAKNRGDIEGESREDAMYGEIDSKEILAIIREVKEEFDSIIMTEEPDADWKGLTDSLANEIKLRDDIDAEISSLFNKREELMENYVHNINNEAFKNEEENNLGKISEIDRKIKDLDNKFVDALLSCKGAQDANGDKTDDVLKKLFAERDVTMRLLFALKTKEGQRRYTTEGELIANNASSLRKDLEEQLQSLDSRILEHKSGDQLEKIERVQSPNLLAVMKKIQDETETLKNEVENDKIFLREYKPQDLITEKGEEVDALGLTSDEESEDAIEAKMADIKVRIVDLEDKRTEILLTEREADEEDEIEATEMIQKIHDMENALKDFEKKLRILEKKEDLERKIKIIENYSEISSEDTDGDKVQEKYDMSLEALEGVYRTIEGFMVAIENELEKQSALASKDRQRENLKHKETDELHDVLRFKIEDLLKERMDIEQNREKIANEIQDQGQLQKLVDERKDIIEKLNDIYKVYDNELANTNLPKCIYDKRQDYLHGKQKRKFLELKKQEIARCLEDLEVEKVASLENSTSGFSDIEETEEKLEIMAKENREKDEIIDNLGQKISALEKELEILNDEFHKNEECMLEEIDKNNKEISTLTGQLDAERNKNKEMEEQIRMLDKLKEELKTKGRRVVKIENENIKSMSPTREDLIGEEKEPGDSNDLRHEIDKISAVEEIMKLAAELISENERKTAECDELETEKGELADISEELLAECQELKEDNEKWKKKLKEIEDKTEKIEHEKVDLQQKLERIKDDSYDLTQENEKLKNALEIAITDYETVQDDVSNLRQENSSINDEIQILKTQLELNGKEKENRKQQFVDKEQEIVACESRVLLNESDSAIDVEEFNDKGEKDAPYSKAMQEDPAKIETARLLAEIKSLSSANEILDDKILQEQKKRKSLDEKNKNLDSLLNEQNREIEEHRTSEAQLRSVNKDLEMQNEDLEYKVKRSMRENDAVLSRLRELEEERDKLLGILDQLKGKLKEERKKSLDEKQAFDEELRSKADEVSRLKSNSEQEKEQLEKTMLSKDRKLKKLEFQLDEEKEAYEELQRNFDRVKKAKESILTDYEKQLQNLQEEIARHKKQEAALDFENLAKKDEIALLKEKLNKINKQCKQQREEIERLTSENRNQMNAYNNQAKEAENKEAEIQQLEDKNRELHLVINRRNERIEELEESLQRKSRMDGKIDSEYEVIQKVYEEKLQTAKKDLQAKELDNESIRKMCANMKEKLNQKDVEMSQMMSEYQRESRGLRNKISELELEVENTKTRNEMKRADAENLIEKTEKQLAEKSEKANVRERENEKLKMDVRHLEALLTQIKERRENEIKSLEMRVEDMEDRNKTLKERNVKMQEKLTKEIEEKEELKIIKRNYLIVKDKNAVLKEKVLELSQNIEAKIEAERLNKELQKAKEDYEKLKNESVKVIKHSSDMKNEIKRLKNQVSLVKKESEKEQKLLVENLENEFRKKIEEMIRSNLQEKEKLLDMWDEERDNWEEEMKEEMEKSRYELERKLKEQKRDMESEHMNRFSKMMNENNRVVNELNERLKELENERYRMERKFDEEISSRENQFVGEKEYMAMMIRELLRNIIDNKSKQSQMKQSHIKEVKIIEDKYEHDKKNMDMRLKEELQLLREKVTEMLRKDVGGRNSPRVYSKMDDELLLDFVPRKLR